MIWPFSRDARRRLRANEQHVGCPECKGTEPKYSIALLSSFVRRDGQVDRLPTGDLVSCQECGAVFAVGPFGVFKRDPRAIPYVADPFAQQTVTRGEALSVDPGEGLPPIARERPRL